MFLIECSFLFSFFCCGPCRETICRTVLRSIVDQIVIDELRAKRKHSTAIAANKTSSSSSASTHNKMSSSISVSTSLCQLPPAKKPFVPAVPVIVKPLPTSFPSTAASDLTRFSKIQSPIRSKIDFADAGASHVRPLQPGTLASTRTQSVAETTIPTPPPLPFPLLAQSSSLGLRGFTANPPPLPNILRASPSARSSVSLPANSSSSAVLLAGGASALPCQVTTSQGQVTSAFLTSPASQARGEVSVPATAGGAIRLKHQTNFPTGQYLILQQGPGAKPQVFVVQNAPHTQTQPVPLQVVPTQTLPEEPCVVEQPPPSRSTIAEPPEEEAEEVDVEEESPIVINITESKKAPSTATQVRRVFFS